MEGGDKCSLTSKFTWWLNSQQLFVPHVSSLPKKLTDG